MALLDGKVAIVTGAGGGLGRAHALALAAEGCRVLVNDVGGARDGVGSGSTMADAVAAEIRDAGGEALANHASVAKVDGARSIAGDAIKAWGRLDIVVNNAGILRDKSLLKLEPANFDSVLAVHARGTYLVTRAAVSVMKEHGFGGSIINTTSIAGLKGNFGQTNYACAKAGIYGMTLVWSKELIRAGIRVNAIAPVAKTRMTVDIDSVPEDFTPEQVSVLVVFLASELAGGVNGRIFGAHGRLLFEYHMLLSPGVQRDEGTWTPAEIAEKLPSISALHPAGRSGGSQDLAPDPPSSQRVAPPGLKESNRVPSTQDLLDHVFAGMPEVFVPSRAAGWCARIHFDFPDADGWTVLVDDGACTTIKGHDGTPTCTITYDSAQTMLSLVAGKLNPQQAFLGGKIKADNMADLMKFAGAFDMKKGAEMAKAEHAGGESGKLAPKPAAAGQKGLNTALLGRRYRGHADLVSAADAVAYAGATNDSNNFYLRDAGAVAPVLYPVRLFQDVVTRAVLDPGLNADLLRLVHGEQEMLFFNLLHPGDLVAPRATIIGIEDKARGQILRVRQRLMRDGEVVCEAVSGYFIRSARAAGSSKREGGQHAVERGTQLFESTFEIDQDQSHRYAAVSLDGNPIHVDDQVAKAAGHPGVILHGLCTMAMTARELVNHACGGDPSRLSRLKVRFSRIVLPGDTLTTRAWKHGESITDGSLVLDVETTNQRGEVVISHGVAEVR